MATLYVLKKPRHRSKVAIIDFDWTICKPKNNKTFPIDVDDWQWLRPSVPDVIKKLYKKGFAICIATNQSKQWKHTQIINALTTLDIPLKICIATTMESYKPSIHIYETLFDKPVDKIKSFMCGDALGRPTDHSDCDLKFAEAIRIKIVSPEELFPFEVPTLHEDNALQLPTTQEMIIMIGMPGSGKSHFAKTTFPNYIIIEGDIHKTSKKMIKVAKHYIENGLSVIFDATNPTHAKRQEYIDAYDNVPFRCIYMNTPMEKAMERNNKREKPVPRVVYNIFNKNLQLSEHIIDIKN